MKINYINKKILLKETFFLQDINFIIHYIQFIFLIFLHFNFI